MQITPTPLPRILFLLTFVTGIVDSVSVLALGRVFTANMTGNIVFIGFAMAGVPGFSLPHSITALAGFLAGAVAGGRLGSLMSQKSRERWVRVAVFCEAILLLLAGFALEGLEIAEATPSMRIYSIIVLTAIAMGLRNATVRRLAVPDLTTTVLTLTVTGVAADSSLAGGNNPRVGYRLASIFLMLLGAASGALLLRIGPAAPLLLSGMLVLVSVALLSTETKKDTSLKTVKVGL